MYTLIQSALIIDNALEKFQINKAHQRSCVPHIRIYMVAKFEYRIYNYVFISVLSPQNKIFLLFSSPFKYHEAFNQQRMWATGSTTLHHHVSTTKTWSLQNTSSREGHLVIVTIGHHRFSKGLRYSVNCNARWHQILLNPLDL